MKHSILKPLISTCTLLFPSIVFSNNSIATHGTMSYSIQSTVAIPALNGVMLLLLSLLFVVITFRMTKQKNTHASKLFLTLLSVGVLSSGTVGVHLISKASAGRDIPLTSSRSVALEVGTNGYVNSELSTAVSITTIDVDSGFTCSAASSGQPECTVGLTLPPSTGKCELSCVSDASSSPS